MSGGERRTVRPVPAREADLVASRPVRGLSFSLSYHRDALDPHAHERSSLTVVLDGGFEETGRNGGRRSVCVAPAALIRPAGEVHADRFGPEGSLNLVIEMDDPRVAEIGGAAAALDRLAVIEDPSLGALGRRARRELLARDAFAALALEGLGLEMLAVAGRASGGDSGDERWLDRIRERLHASPPGGDVTTRELAREADVHPVYLARAFRARFGVSPAEYLRRLRLEWAARELVATHRPAAEIANEAGFFDQSHFTRAFRGEYGTSPGRYRRDPALRGGRPR